MPSLCGIPRHPFLQLRSLDGTVGNMPCGSHLPLAKTPAQLLFGIAHGDRHQVRVLQPGGRTSRLILDQLHRLQPHAALFRFVPFCPGFWLRRDFIGGLPQNAKRRPTNPVVCGGADCGERTDHPGPFPEPVLTCRYYGGAPAVKLTDSGSRNFHVRASD